MSFVLNTKKIKEKKKNKQNKNKYPAEGLFPLANVTIPESMLAKQEIIAKIIIPHTQFLLLIKSAKETLTGAESSIHKSSTKYFEGVLISILVYFKSLTLVSPLKNVDNS
jgi:hypothetical protein